MSPINPPAVMNVTVWNMTMELHVSKEISGSVNIRLFSLYALLRLKLANYKVRARLL
jgi:hypothetical protein